MIQRIWDLTNRGNIALNVEKLVIGSGTASRQVPMVVVLLVGEKLLLLDLSRIDLLRNIKSFTVPFTRGPPVRGVVLGPAPL